MQFTDEVHWNGGDFLVMGIMLIIAVTLLDQIWRKLDNQRLKGLLILVVLAVFLLIWAELGVGMFSRRWAGE